MIVLAFSLGLISSLHCVAMCAPLQAVVLGQWLKARSWPAYLLYHGGRFMTYALLGLLAATFGAALGIPRWQGEFSLIAGLLLLFGYFGFRFLGLDQKIMRLISPWLRRVQGQLRGGRRPLWLWLSGALNGLLPCGMVYAALLPAMGAEQPAQGALYMFFFGLGTLGLLLVFNLFSSQIWARYGSQLQALIPISIAVIALLLILRGLHLDIPYLSPALPKAGASIEHCG